MKKIIFIILFVLLNNWLFGQSTPYTILVSFDGFRWDYLNRGITPNFQEVEKEGVRALSLKPSFPTKTFPNHYSIISGMYPQNHGIIFNSFTNNINGKKYRIGSATEVKNSAWYLGEAFWETARRNGIITASYFWPGSEVDLERRRPNYIMTYNHNTPYIDRIEGVINWLRLPVKERPRFITLYFHDTDTFGHNYGPNSEQINISISRVDTLVGIINDKLKEIGLLDSTNVIFVSDHGMTEISVDRVVNIEKLLENYDVLIGGSKPVMMIKTKNDQLNEVYKLLKERENHYKVYLRDELPTYFHFSKNQFIYPIILVADLGWSLVTERWLKGLQRNNTKGNHGYDNNSTDMHGIFLAKGPSFKSGYQTGTISNIDIYPLLCKIYNIFPRANIDGKLERIEFILK